MKGDRSPGERLLSQFTAAYRKLAKIGEADDIGSFEYVRVFQEWKLAGCPLPARQFIQEAANRPPTCKA